MNQNQDYHEITKSLQQLFQTMNQAFRKSNKPHIKLTIFDLNDLEQQLKFYQKPRQSSQVFPIYCMSTSWIDKWKSYCQNPQLIRESLPLMNQQLKLKQNMNENQKTYINSSVFKYCFSNYKGYILELRQGQQDILIQNKMGDRKLGLIGLNNLNNTCFMNCILQIFIHTEPFKTYFLQQKYIKHIKHQKNLQKQVIYALAAMIKDIWNQTDGSSIYCPDLFLQKISGRQHDAQQFLINLINIIHQGLNRALCKSKVNKFEQVTNLQSMSYRNWKNETNTNFSIITEKIMGQTISRLICLQCKNESYKIQNFNILSLPIPESHKYHQLNYTVIFCNFTYKLLKTYLIYQKDDIYKWRQTAAASLRKPYKRFRFYFLSKQQQIQDLYKLDSNEIMVKLQIHKYQLFLLELTDYQLQLKEPIQIVIRFTKMNIQGQYDNLWYKYPLFMDKNCLGKDIYRRILELIYRRAYNKSEQNIKNKYSQKSISLSQYLQKMAKQRPFELFFKYSKKYIVKNNKKILTFGEKKQLFDEDNLLELISANGAQFEIDVVFTKQSLIKDFDFQKLAQEQIKQNIKVNKKQIQQTQISLQTCFQTFQTPQVLKGGNSVICSQCLTNQPTIKGIQFYKPPQILAIQLKRFRINHKQSCQVKFPFKLNLKKYLIDHKPMTSYSSELIKSKSIPNNNQERQVNYNPQPIYQLYGVCNHKGNMQGGHYTAYIKHQKQWYQFNDQNVKNIQQDEIRSSAAYILFYQLQSIQKKQYS